MTFHGAPLVLLCVAVALSGCVDEGAPIPPAGDAPAEAPAEPGVAAPVAGNGPATPPPGPVPVVTTFALEGATPASVGACGVPAPAGPCVSHVFEAGAHILEIPHVGNVTSLSFTLSFDPATPALTELFHLVFVNHTVLSDGALSSGAEVTVSGLAVNATAKLMFAAWPVGHQTPVGSAWVDPVSQEFVVEGTLGERVASA